MDFSQIIFFSQRHFDKTTRELYLGKFFAIGENGNRFSMNQLVTICCQKLFFFLFPFCNPNPQQRIFIFFFLCSFISPGRFNFSAS